jgi:hypothetical protein
MQHHAIMYESFRRAHIAFWDDAELFGWEPEALIETIRADGALDVVAHATRVRDKDRMRRVLDYARGVEVYTSRHNPAVAARLLDFAITQGKHWTASTDDHQQGPYARPPSGTPRRTVEAILA